MSKIYRLDQVKSRSGHRATSTVYGLIKSGLFPKQVRIGQRSVGWASHEIDAVIDARIAGKSDAEIQTLVKQLHANRANAGLPVQPHKAAPTKAKGLELVEA